MDLPVNTFKRAIKAGKQQIGLWSSLSSNVTVEVIAGSGFDWILIDTEHSPNELPMVLSQLQAATGGTAHPVVRPAWNDTVLIKRFLDAGVQSFLIPYVQTEEEARAAVAATRYPPKGVRGFASASRASRFGRVKDYYAHADEEICVLVQIETQQGLDNLETIARVEGVDGVFIGPGDLSAALGYLGSPGHLEMQPVIEDAIARIKAAGSVPGILTGDEKLARRYIELGCLFTAVGADIGILARGSEQLAAKFKGG
jgi:4-hydroxy-2-oxoheptanedioate aldolase